MNCRARVGVIVHPQVQSKNTLSSVRASALVFTYFVAAGFVTQAAAIPDTTRNLPIEPVSLGGSFIRMIGAMAIVIAVFLGGVWMTRSWRRWMPGTQRKQRLSILEAQSMGNRQMIFVVAYDQQRMLVGTSPTGMALLSHLPDEEAPTAIEPEKPVSSNFAKALMSAIGGKR